VKPPIKYFGAKVNLADRLVSLMPEHDGYVEPFAGSLAVLLAKPKSRLEVVNDLDRHLVTFWRVLRDHPEAFNAAAGLTPHARSEYEAATALDGASELELARQVWIVLTQGRAGTLNRAGWRFYRDPAGSFEPYMAAYRDRLLPVAERIAGVTLECRPAVDVARDYGVHSSSLLYVDPPYPISTRRQRRYAEEMTDSDHEELAEVLHACEASVMVSGYDCALYSGLYSDWHSVQLAAASNNAAIGSMGRTEVVWCNRPLVGQQAFDLGGLS